MTLSPSSKTTLPYQQGATAQFENKPPFSAPYEFGTPEQQEFAEGYTDARKWVEGFFDPALVPFQSYIEIDDEEDCWPMVLIHFCSIETAGLSLEAAATEFYNRILDTPELREEWITGLSGTSWMDVLERIPDDILKKHGLLAVSDDLPLGAVCRRGRSIGVVHEASLFDFDIDDPEAERDEFCFNVDTRPEA